MWTQSLCLTQNVVEWVIRRQRLLTDEFEIYQLVLPDVVVLAEDHPSFAVAGAAILAQLSVAAGALEAARVPVSLHGEEQETVCNSTSTSCTQPARLHPATAHHCHCGCLYSAVHHSNLKTWQEVKERIPQTKTEARQWKSKEKC